MAKAAAMAGALFAIALAAMQGCSPFGGVNAFTCATDTDCSGGFCEADGLCSFTDSTCMSGRRYGELAGGQSGNCVGGTTPDDGSVDEQVIGPEAGDSCFGSVGGFVQPCFGPQQVPTGAVTITAAINTTNDPLCSTVVTGTTACVIAGDSIAINGNIAVTGDRPLILLATTGAITITGQLDVASKRVGNKTGPGFNGTCNAPTAAGASGGGAGGSFGALGGNGGNGAMGTGGQAGPVPTIDFRGGCPGQNGNNGQGGDNTEGVAGNGGGAVYLIAATQVALVGGTSEINASGGGGQGGESASAGGGGGGSGGMIVVDAPALANAGTIYAKGGGGGAGSGQVTAGGDGGDPNAAMAGAAGTPGTGGAGGAGGTTTTGGNGANDADRGGGGAGGGAGVIKLFGGATSNGTVVPGPS